MLLSLQARINGELGIQLHNGIQAATISFLVGFTGLGVLLMFSASMRKGFARIPAQLRARQLKRWHLLGGIGGALFVVAQVYAVPLLGVALFTVVIVAAEVVSALIIDRIGIGPGGVRRPTLSRISGAGIAIIAVCVASLDRFDVVTASAFALIAIVLTRFGTIVQSAINARVAVAAGSALTASFISFALGTAFLLVVLGGLALANIVEINLTALPWWMYTGGFMGAIIVVLIALLVPRVGVLIFGLSTIAGQVFGALLVDLLAPSAGSQVTVVTFIGSIVAILAVLVALDPVSLRRQQRTPQASK